MAWQAFFSVYGTQSNPHNFKRERVQVFLQSSKNQLKLTSWNYLTVFDVYKRCRALREMVTASGYDPRAVFELLLNTAQFELKLKEVCNHHHDLYFYGLPLYLRWSELYFLSFKYRHRTQPLIRTLILQHSFSYAWFSSVYLY